MTKTYTYKEFVDKFIPNMRCPNCKNAVPIRRKIRGEFWRICPSCDYMELDENQFNLIVEDKDEKSI